MITFQLAEMKSAFYILFQLTFIYSNIFNRFNFSFQF